MHPGLPLVGEVEATAAVENQIVDAFEAFAVAVTEDSGHPPRLRGELAPDIRRACASKPRQEHLWERAMETFSTKP